MELTKIAPYQTIFQNYELTCPITEGHKMLPVKQVCAILDVDYKTQYDWIKQHPFFGKLWGICPTTGADEKQYEMFCLSFFDTYAWIASIDARSRKEGSIEKQTLFLVWLREQMMGFYKSVDVFIQENKYELQLEQLKDELETKLLENNKAAKDIKTKLKEIDDTINDIRHNRFTGQTALPFPEEI